MEGFAVIVVLIIVTRVIFPMLKKMAETKSTEQKEAHDHAAEQRRAPSVDLHRPAPAAQRPTPTIRTAQRDFSAPEAPCIVCEQTGEDHFVRDKARRIAQLDEWLKNGLIDRNEYRVMKDRYERGI